LHRGWDRDRNDGFRDRDGRFRDRDNFAKKDDVGSRIGAQGGKKDNHAGLSNGNKDHATTHTNDHATTHTANFNHHSATPSPAKAKSPAPSGKSRGKK
jgi:hypothetical protein